MATVARVGKGREGGGRSDESSSWGGRRGLACLKASRAVCSPRALLTDMCTVGSCRRWGRPPPLLNFREGKGAWLGAGGVRRCSGGKGYQGEVHTCQESGARVVIPAPLLPPLSHLLPWTFAPRPLSTCPSASLVSWGGGGGWGVVGGWLLLSLATTPSLLDPHTRPRAAARRPLPSSRLLPPPPLAQPCPCRKNSAARRQPSRAPRGRWVAQRDRETA